MNRKSPVSRNKTKRIKSRRHPSNTLSLSRSKCPPIRSRTRLSACLRRSGNLARSHHPINILEKQNSLTFLLRQRMVRKSFRGLALAQRITLSIPGEESTRSNRSLPASTTCITRTMRQSLLRPRTARETSTLNTNPGTFKRRLSGSQALSTIRWRRARVRTASNQTSVSTRHTTL